MTKKLPNFVKYISELLTCAYNNYNLITQIKAEKQKRKNLRIFLSIREEVKRNSRFNKHILKSGTFNFRNKLKNNNIKLKKYLDHIGKQLYKEEETRNYNLYNKFTKTGYILSTVKMIDDLLSDDFKNVLQKMKKIEITRPKEDIKDLINKMIMRKNQKSYDEQTNINTKGSFNNIYTLKKDNKENSSINNFSIKDNNKNLYIKNNSLISIKKNIDKKSIINYKKYNTNNNRRSINYSSINDKNTRIFNGIYKDKLKKNNIERNYNYSNIEDNKSNLVIFKKYHLTKINSGLLSSSRSSNSKDKVQKYPIDKDNFNKEFIKKKIYLEKICNKELNFHKNLLKTKSCAREFVQPPNEFDIKKVIKDAELNFSIKFEIAKSGRGKKNLNNLIKQNLNIMKKKTLSNKIIRPSSLINENNNEIKLKELNLDCIKITYKANELIKKRKNILLGIN